MKTQKYKLKLLCTRTNFVRYRECNLTHDHYLKMKKQVNKIAPNGYKLMDIWVL